MAHEQYRPQLLGQEGPDITQMNEGRSEGGKYLVGERAWLDNTEYVYTKNITGADIPKGSAVFLDDNMESAALADSAGATYPRAIGFSGALVEPDQFFWVAVQGVGLKGLGAAGSVIEAPIFTSATGGELTSTAGGVQVSGLRISDATPDAEGFLTFSSVLPMTVG